MASDKGPLGSASAPTDDSDLEDLIAKSPTNKDETSVDMINLEQLTQDDERSSKGVSQVYSRNEPGLMSMTPLGFICGHARLCCYNYPCVSKCFLTLGALGFVAFLSNTLFNPFKPIGVMGGDYTAITSSFEMSLGQVDHWCIKGDNDSCKCEDPLEPSSRAEFKSWVAAHKANKADVKLYQALYGSDPTELDEDGETRPPIDVVFLGESVVEAMDGRWLGKKMKAFRPQREGEEDPNKVTIDQTFEKHFRKKKGADIEGLALGIAGDTCANVLWRIQHDEITSDFNPQVWWLVLGMNDLARMQCSEEIVVLGILRVVEEIHIRKPDAKIVINSLLPMIDFQSREQPKMADFADFTAKRGNKYPKREVPPSFRMRDKNEGEPNGRLLTEEITDNHASFDSQENDIDLEPERGLRKLQKSDDRPKRAKTKKQRQRDEDNATGGPELEKALERRKKQLEAMDKKKRDKIFKDADKYRPKKPVAPLLPFKRPVMPPVWPSIHVINGELKKFCEKHDQISFFDATSIFASNEGNGGHRLYNELISPRGHPTERGFQVWEDEVKLRLLKMLRVPPKKSHVDIEREHIGEGKMAEPTPQGGIDELPYRGDSGEQAVASSESSNEEVADNGEQAVSSPESSNEEGADNGEQAVSSSESSNDEGTNNGERAVSSSESSNDEGANNGEQESSPPQSPNENSEGERETTTGEGVQESNGEGETTTGEGVQESNGEGEATTEGDVKESRKELNEGHVVGSREEGQNDHGERGQKVENREESEITQNKSREDTEGGNSNESKQEIKEETAVDP